MSEDTAAVVEVSVDESKIIAKRSARDTEGFRSKKDLADYLLAEERRNRRKTVPDGSRSPAACVGALYGAEAYATIRAKVKTAKLAEMEKAPWIIDEMVAKQKVKAGWDEFAEADAAARQAEAEANAADDEDYEDDE